MIDCCTRIVPSTHRLDNKSCNTRTQQSSNLNYSCFCAWIGWRFSSKYHDLTHLLFIFFLICTKILVSVPHCLPIIPFMLTPVTLIFLLPVISLILLFQAHLLYPIFVSIISYFLFLSVTLYIQWRMTVGIASKKAVSRNKHKFWEIDHAITSHLGHIIMLHL